MNMNTIAKTGGDSRAMSAKALRIELRRLKRMGFFRSPYMGRHEPMGAFYVTTAGKLSIWLPPEPKRPAQRLRRAPTLIDGLAVVLTVPADMSRETAVAAVEGVTLQECGQFAERRIDVTIPEAGPIETPQGSVLVRRGELEWDCVAGFRLYWARTPRLPLLAWQRRSTC